jgi:hypothetical protein
VAGLAAFTHGLVVQALFDPRAFPHKRLRHLLESHLEALRPAVKASLQLPEGVDSLQLLDRDDRF